MILPNVRASFSANEIDILVRVLERETRRSRRALERQMIEEGLDSLLDHPGTFSAIMDRGGLSAIPSRLVFYVMVRRTLLDSGLENPIVADYIAALLIEFAMGQRAYRIAPYDDATYHYLVDLIADLEEETSERRKFLLQVHLGNFSLWLSGLFPDHVVARVHRRGAPGFAYYEDLGATGYRLASTCELAGQFDLARVYIEVADGFRAVRRALNRVSDHYFFRRPPSPVDRLLGEVADGLREG
ncbi:MAG: hypothetical protein GWN99_07705 [Gemmatimonadetes bacterium]|uniref:Uncharacterized protein n=1 Tax=Candidatus Kutchimonas denitrificans TaxID=3056748 RepID=A0AAE4Z7L5_9BACT|nr:hypothetical protein [Gemmatimonadota bacterium]NIR75113.1 hypothetical protein [Candidatus Kutchimonas denitrificans]NIS00945.1 hypothetical protein [Gemmatimonadota bacterium]NIT66562.1 hypothetical protein [Gemmatimonadota bacterium]NIU52908.1 hypothetical protein [Gemmatimonadota bacterium]